MDISDTQVKGPNEKLHFPWYDSPWLSAYVQARNIISSAAPAKLPKFEDRISVLRTAQDFEVKYLENFLTPEIHEKIREVVRTTQLSELDPSEAKNFGRMMVQNLEYFNKLQQEFAQVVSKHVGEDVVPCYNFLSLYTHMGVCEPHMDAPSAKWTLDICIDQSVEWPIHFSKVVEWPENHDLSPDNWQAQIKDDSNLDFTQHTLSPGDALLFAGSSQWHYRDRIPSEAAGAKDFCHLLFMHYVPKGSERILNPAAWHRHFGVPELKVIDWSEGVGFFEQPGKIEKLAKRVYHALRGI